MAEVGGSTIVKPNNGGEVREGATSRVEIRGIRRDLVGELDQIRSLVTDLEAKELQLTTHDTNTNGGFNNVGRITAIPSVAEFAEKEKRTPKANQYYTSSEFLLGKNHCLRKAIKN
ncbi:hypothetical protein KY284_001015 [Solanum tuberosum]|nr:hypothetical protein KY284_001015 [Solanum tuberosum]